MRDGVVVLRHAWEAESSFRVGEVVCAVLCLTRFSSNVRLPLRKGAVDTYQLLQFKISAWLYDAPMTLRSVGGVALFFSRWLLADAVRQNGDPVLLSLPVSRVGASMCMMRQGVRSAIPTQIGL